MKTFSIENEYLSAAFSEIGGELISLKSKKDGTEYIWVGDSTYWAGHAPNLFPINGRLTDGKYTYKGKTYEMILHGFIKVTPLAVKEQKADAITFELAANDETKAQYPFDFVYTVSYRLEGKTLVTEYKAENKGKNDMFFAFGGHPGFNIPFAGEGAFTDYYVEFGKTCAPRSLVLDACYMSDNTAPFALEGNKRCYLRHDMFDNDAIFLYNMADTVTLTSDKTDKSITVHYPDMKYLGLWHKPCTEAPYMCIEPWMSVPAFNGKIDDMETKRDMKKLACGESYRTHIDITVQ